MWTFIHMGYPKLLSIWDIQKFRVFHLCFQPINLLAMDIPSYQVSEVPSKHQGPPRTSRERIAHRNLPQLPWWKILSGWWLSHLPLWKLMDFVSWDDDIPFPTVSGKSIQIPWFQSPPTSCGWWWRYDCTWGCYPLENGPFMDELLKLSCEKWLFSMAQIDWPAEAEVSARFFEAVFFVSYENIKPFRTNII